MANTISTWLARAEPLRRFNLPAAHVPIRLADVDDAVPASAPHRSAVFRSGNPLLENADGFDASQVPIIYTRVTSEQPLSKWMRLFMAVIPAACLTVLCTAARLTPSHSGMGTHLQLGLQDCGFKVRTGLPCPSCGYTTAFTWFAHGNVLKSFYTQPMGCVLAFLAAAIVWGGFYIAMTGRPVHRLLRFVPGRYYLMPFLLFGVLAWAWKIFLTLRGWD